MNLQLVICQESTFGGFLTDLGLDLGEGRETVECKQLKSSRMFLINSVIAVFHRPFIDGLLEGNEKDRTVQTEASSWIFLR